MHTAKVETARLRIAAGKLPATKRTTLGGYSRGTTCDLCRQPIFCGAPEIELASGSAASYVLHPGCFSAWAIAVMDAAPDAKAPSRECAEPA